MLPQAAMALSRQEYIRCSARSGNLLWIWGCHARLAAVAATGSLAALLANQFTPAIAESLVQKIKLPRRLDKMLYKIHKIVSQV